MAGRGSTVPMAWTTLVARTVRETVDDDCLGLAAQLAYYLFLALFPAVLFLISVASFFPLQNLADDLGRVIGPFVSPEVLGIIQEQMRRLGNADSGGLLTLGVAGAIWSSSAAMVSIVDSLNRAYDLPETRPWWKVRLLAIALTMALALLIVVSMCLVMAGPSLATYLGQTIGLGIVLEWTWKIVQWPVALGLVSLGFGFVYYVGPNEPRRWTWISPGAAFATIAWLLSSLAFKFYIENFTDYNAAYGSIGGVIVLLLWFYVSGLALLVGAEMNAEIEHASPSARGVDDGKIIAGRGEALAAPSSAAIDTETSLASRAAGITLASLVIGSRWLSRLRSSTARGKRHD